jgi:hypothetical protein
MIEKILNPIKMAERLSRTARHTSDLPLLIPQFLVAPVWHKLKVDMNENSRISHSIQRSLVFTLARASIQVRTSVSVSSIGISTSNTMSNA